MGVRELDFYPYLGEAAVEEAFIEAYTQASGYVVNMENVATVRTLRTFIKDYQARHSAPVQPDAAVTPKALQA